MKGQEAEHQLNELAKGNLKRDTEGSTCGEDKKHTSVFIGIHGALSSLVSKGKGSSEHDSRQEGENCASVEPCQRRIAGWCNRLQAF